MGGPPSAMGALDGPDRRAKRNAPNRLPHNA
jgi:hypothetical protein